MKNKELTIALLVVVIVILLFSLKQEPPVVKAPVKKEIIDLSTLESIELNPPTDYISRLETIIDTHTDPYVRERGIFTLTQIALMKKESGKIVDYLKKKANKEVDDNVRTAAYANLDLIREYNPLPKTGSMKLTVDGEIKKGKEIDLIATLSATRDYTDVVVGLQPVSGKFTVLSKAVYQVDLKADKEKRINFKLKIDEYGKHIFHVNTLMSYDRADHEKIYNEGIFVVNETHASFEDVENII